MKQTLEEAANQNAEIEMKKVLNVRATAKRSFIAGAEWHAKQSIEVLSSVLENWVHGGDADCIIAEFEELLNK